MLVMVETFCFPATQPGSDTVCRHSSFNMRDMFWATTTRLLKTHSIEIRFVIGPEIILFVGVCVQFSARKFYWLGQ